MKNLSLFVSAAVLLSASSAFAAINCATLPTCASLGYDTAKANCPSSKFLACPFDTNTGKCMHDAAVGDLKYSLKSANHDGWLLCNGQSISKTTYSALYSVIGTNYGGSGDNFNVPDYRGFFLRAYGTATVNNALSSFGGSANSDVKKPQKEQLPNITGDWISGTFSDAWSSRGAIYGKADGSREGADNSRGTRAYFDASKSNTIYTTGGHVIPANYAAYVFIYAGK